MEAAADQTIGEALKELEDFQAINRTKKLAGVATDTAAEIPRAAVPGAGLIGLVVDTYKSVKNIAKGNAPGAEIDKIQDYPLLDLFDIHPLFFEVLDDALLDKIEDLYEQEVLRKAKPNDKVSSLIDINTYISKHLSLYYSVTFQLEDLDDLGPVQ